MMHALRTARVLLLACLVGPPVSPEWAGAQEQRTSRFEVEGVDVIHREGIASDVVSVRLFLPGGSQQLVEHPEGIEALALNVIGAASDEAIAAAGGRRVASVGRDWSTTGFLTLDDYLDDVWSAWATGLTEATFSGDDVLRHRRALLSDARQRFADPDAWVRELAWQSIFRDHPYRLDPRGTTRTLDRITVDQVTSYWNDEFVRSRMLLVVVGNVPRDRLAPLVSATLATRPEGDYGWSSPPTVQRFPGTWRQEPRDLPTNYIYGFMVGPRPGEPDYYAFEVATNLLSGRLNAVLRDEHSLTYSTYASFEPGSIPTAAVAASSATPPEVYRLLIEQMEWVQTLNRVPEWMLNRYLEQFTLDQYSRDLTADGQALALGEAALLFGDHRQADRYLENIQAVSPDEIRQVAIDYMLEIQLAYLGDTSWLRRGMVGGR